MLPVVLILLVYHFPRISVLSFFGGAGEGRVCPGSSLVFFKVSTHHRICVCASGYAADASRQELLAHQASSPVSPTSPWGVLSPSSNRLRELLGSQHHQQRIAVPKLFTHNEGPLRQLLTQRQRPFCVSCGNLLGLTAQAQKPTVLIGRRLAQDDAAAAKKEDEWTTETNDLRSLELVVA